MKGWQEHLAILGLLAFAALSGVQLGMALKTKELRKAERVLSTCIGVLDAEQIRDRAADIRLRLEDEGRVE